MGHDFEAYLHQTIGGESQYIKGSTAGRDFDGVFGTRWYEAKSGNYWNKLLQDKSIERKFKQKMAEGLKIAQEHGATYELFSKSDKVVYNTGIYYYYYQRADSIMGERKMSFSSDGLEAYEQMADFFEKRGENYILQLIRYRYLCLLKKYAEELRKTDHSERAEMLWEKYKEEYKKSIRSIRKSKRRFRLRMYRWFRISF